jgi:hypothetical protein
MSGCFEGAYFPRISAHDGDQEKEKRTELFRLCTAERCVGWVNIVLSVCTCLYVGALKHIWRLVLGHTQDAIVMDLHAGFGCSLHYFIGWVCPTAASHIKFVTT